MSDDDRKVTEDELNREKKTKKKKKHAHEDDGEDEAHEDRKRHHESGDEEVRKKKKKKDKKREKESTESPQKNSEVEKKGDEPVKISAEDVASMASEELKKQEEAANASTGTNLGQYTGATLEGGDARLSKFARLMGGKKKESKGLFGQRKATAVGTHNNVTDGAGLNKRLEEQFQRAKHYHQKHVRGFQQ